MRSIRLVRCLALVAAALWGPATALAIVPHRHSHTRVTSPATGTYTVSGNIDL